MINTDDTVPDDIYFKNLSILMAYIIKDGNKFDLQIFLEETLVKKPWEVGKSSTQVGKSYQKVINIVKWW